MAYKQVGDLSLELSTSLENKLTDVYAKRDAMVPKFGDALGKKLAAAKTIHWGAAAERAAGSARAQELFGGGTKQIMDGINNKTLLIGGARAAFLVWKFVL